MEDIMSSNKIKKLTPLIETKFLSLYDAQYTNRSGNEKHWIIASRKDFDTLKAQFAKEREERIDAVIIAALHKETKSLVLIRQFRVPLNDYVYELPAGLLDKDEVVEAAVSRELKEETGLSLIDINYKKTNSKVYISAGMTDESVAIVYCTCSGEVSNKFLEEDEDIEAILVSQETAEEMLKKDVKMDIKVWIILQSFINSGEQMF
jgi:ADP-ribose pyrophosphatase